MWRTLNLYITLLGHGIMSVSPSSYMPLVSRASVKSKHAESWARRVMRSLFKCPDLLPVISVKYVMISLTCLSRTRLWVCEMKTDMI